MGFSSGSRGGGVRGGSTFSGGGGLSEADESGVLMAEEIRKAEQADNPITPCPAGQGMPEGCGRGDELDRCESRSISERCFELLLLELPLFVFARVAHLLPVRFVLCRGGRDAGPETINHRLTQRARRRAIFCAAFLFGEGCLKRHGLAARFTFVTLPHECSCGRWMLTS